MEHLLTTSEPDSFFIPVKEGAILDEDYEDLQTYEKFASSRTRYKITKRRHTLHVYNIGKMPKRYQKLSLKLIEFIRCFFTLTTIVKGNLVVKYSGNKKQEYIVHPEGNENEYYVKSQTRIREDSDSIPNSKSVLELDASDLLGVLGLYVENDTYTVIGITSHRIYNPKYKDDVIMGFGCGSRSCVISIPDCYDEKIKNSASADKAALYEMIKTVAHETSHTMGIDHCVEYSCIMNSQYVKEKSSSPIYFCPICIRKLHEAIKFDCPSRWQQLANYFTKNGFKGAAKWTQKRLQLWLKDSTQIHQ